MGYEKMIIYKHFVQKQLGLLGTVLVLQLILPYYYYYHYYIIV